jgi:uncharacterized membrane protein
VDQIERQINDIRLFALFCYAFVFQWAFDRVFDVPAATKGL